MNCININLPQNLDMDIILERFKNLENKMATMKEIMEAARSQQDLIVAAVDQIHALVTEVKQLLDANDVAGAQALLDNIAANSEAIVKVTLEGADVAAAVDAVNGDPVVVDENL